jgi:hypothetical protein
MKDIMVLKPMVKKQKMRIPVNIFRRVTEDRVSHSHFSEHVRVKNRRLPVATSDLSLQLVPEESPLFAWITGMLIA